MLLHTTLLDSCVLSLTLANGTIGNARRSYLVGLRHPLDKRRAQILAGGFEH